MARSSSLSIRVANVFGALGYMALALQWTWVIILYGPSLIETPMRHIFLPPEPSDSAPIPTIAVPELSIAGVIIAIVITVFVIALTIYVIYKLPTAIGKTGHKVTYTAASSIVPIVTKHKPIEKQKRRRLTARIIMYVKLFLILAPLIGTLPLSYLDNLPLDFTIVLAVSFGVALLSIGCFSIQYTIARIRRADSSRLW